VVKVATVSNRADRTSYPDSPAFNARYGNERHDCRNEERDDCQGFRQSGVLTTSGAKQRSRR